VWDFCQDPDTIGVTFMTLAPQIDFKITTAEQKRKHLPTEKKFQNALSGMGRCKKQFRVHESFAEHPFHC
jgi:hypothetical protein